MKKMMAIIQVIVICFGMVGCFPTVVDEKDDTSNGKTQDVYLGETAINSDGVEFVVQSVNDTQKIGYTATENNFIIVTIKISNNGKESWEQNPNNCVLILGDVQYEYSNATYSLDTPMSGFNKINPGITKTMSIAFETPSKSTENSYSIKLHGYSFWTDDSVTIILKERTK